VGEGLEAVPLISVEIKRESFVILRMAPIQLPGEILIVIAQRHDQTPGALFRDHHPLRRLRMILPHERIPSGPERA
jgi:hypothetical protein